MKRFSWRKLAIVIGLLIAFVPMLLLVLNTTAWLKYQTFRAPTLLYPNAVEIEREELIDGVRLLLTTTDDTETVLNYYEAQLRWAGWTLEERVGTSMMMSYKILSFGKYLFTDNYTLSNDPVYGLRVQIYRQPSGMTYIEIGYDKVRYID